MRNSQRAGRPFWGFRTQLQSARFPHFAWRVPGGEFWNLNHREAEGGGSAMQSLVAG